MKGWVKFCEVLVAGRIVAPWEIFILGTSELRSTLVGTMTEIVLLFWSIVVPSYWPGRVKDIIFAASEGHPVSKVPIIGLLACP